jgi:DNA-binding transcriptional LysR family regulator
MDQFKQLSTFVAVATKGSLTAAAKSEGIAPAMIGRRLDALEDRLGVKLLLRTTRKVTLTAEGASFLDDCQRLITDLNSAEAAVSAGSVKATGHLRITAPAGFGRKHIAPLIPEFMVQHPGVKVTLELSDRIVDLLNEPFDCAVRVGELTDSNLVAVRLTSNQRVIIAAPSYLKRAGTPTSISDLDRHNCLVHGSAGLAGTQRNWALQDSDGQALTYKVTGTMECNDGSAVHDWVMAGHGLAVRSWWEVGDEVKAKLLTTVLDDFAPPPTGIYAVFPARKHLPLRVRVWVDFLKMQFAKSKFVRK